jgi:hypothetical protein
MRHLNIEDFDPTDSNAAMDVWKDRARLIKQLAELQARYDRLNAAYDQKEKISMIYDDGFGGKR